MVRQRLSCQRPDKIEQINCISSHSTSNKALEIPLIWFFLPETRCGRFLVDLWLLHHWQEFAKKLKRSLFVYPLIQVLFKNVERKNMDLPFEWAEPTASAQSRNKFVSKLWGSIFWFFSFAIFDYSLTLTYITRWCRKVRKWRKVGWNLLSAALFQALKHFCFPWGHQTCNLSRN